MKTITSLIITLFFFTQLEAQVTRTVELTAGSLATELTTEELNTITDLTITGTIDARDFKTMRDEMPVLTVLDMSAVTIEAYTEPTYQIEYPANSIPRKGPTWTDAWIESSLSEKTSLTTIVLPTSLTEIGSNAFMGCTGLLEIDIPPSVVKIDGGAFSGCTALAECTLPSSVQTIGGGAFLGCSSLSSIELPSKLRIIDTYTFSECSSLTNVFIPATVTKINENAFSYCSSLENIVFPSSHTIIGSLAFYKCTALTSVAIPTSVTTIESSAFSGCSNITTLSLPRTLQVLVSSAFELCTSLTSIYNFAPMPLELEDTEVGVFFEVDKANCTLYVPKGSKALYEAANQWKDFPNIVEMPGFTISASSVILEASEGNATVEIGPEDDWTTSSDASWLTVSPVTGSGVATLTLTADNNTAVGSRLAKVVVTLTDGLSQDITVIQKGESKTIHVETAGNLYTYFSAEELTDITHLILTGEIDARDFKLIRDKMPFLEVLDIGATTIEAYSGPDGTDEYSTNYEEDEIPNNALENYIEERKGRLTTLVLPESTTGIGYEAFANCRALNGIEIPSLVTNIQTYAFDACTSLTELNLPSSVITIHAQAFRNCTSLNNIELPSSITEIGNATFEDCISLTSVTLPVNLTRISSRLFYSCIALKTVVIGPAVTSIEEEAFFNCTSLESIKIPASVTNIGNRTFALCESLTSVYSFPVNPPETEELGMGFQSNVLEEAILYVPLGTKEIYANAVGWKDFTHIVEMGEFNVSDTTVTLQSQANSQATITLNSFLPWTAMSNQEWLSVDPVSGNEGQELTLTATANPSDTTRTALVTVSANGYPSLIITVTQHGLTVGMEELETSSQVKYYPNPFSQTLTVEISNPSLKELSVVVFNVTGQRIKSLARAAKEPKISLEWDGRNEQGMMVPFGLYSLKINEESIQVVFGK